MKKLLSILLIVLMSLCVLTINVAAEDYEASIDGVQYETLEAAIIAAEENDIITLEKDVSRAPSDISDSIDIPASKTITIDLNEKEIKTTNGIRVLNVLGDLTLTNGKLASLKNVDCIIFVNQNAKLYLNEVEINAFQNREAIYTNGNDSNVLIDITNSTINGRCYFPADGTYNIHSGTFAGRNGAFYFKSGTINIENGDYSSTSTDGDWAHSDSGALWTGEAVVVEACNYPGGNPIVNITGGTFTGGTPAQGSEYKNYGILIIEYGDNNKADLSKTSVPCRLGKVSGHVYDGKHMPSDGLYHFNDSNTTLVNVAKVGDTYYRTIEDAIESIDTSSQTKIDVVQDIKDIEKAIVIPSNKNIVLDLNGHTICNNDNYELNRNKDRNNDSIFVVSRGTTLTIDDSSTEKNGKIEAVNKDKIYSAIKLTTTTNGENGNSANLIVNAGSIIGQYYGVAGNGSRHNTEITINGGTIKGNTLIDSSGIYHPQSGILTINGGTIIGTTGLYIKSGKVITNVNSGTIKSEGTVITAYNPDRTGDGFDPTGDTFVLDNCNYPGGEPKASIRGGYFFNEVNNTKSVASYAKTGKDPITKFIKGGYFVTEPDSDYICDGFKAYALESTDLEYAGGLRYKVAPINEESYEIKEDNVDGVDTIVESLVEGDAIETVVGLNNAVNTSSIINETIQNNPNAKDIEVEIVMNTKEVENNDDTQAIDAELDDTKGQSVNTYLDLTINQTIKVDGEVVKEEKITKTSAYQYITVKVNNELTSVINKVFVIRKHGDDVSFLQKVASEYDAANYGGDCYYIIGNQTNGYSIVIKSKNFSVYAIGCQNIETSVYKYVPRSDYEVPNTGVKG